MTTEQDSTSEQADDLVESAVKDDREDVSDEKTDRRRRWRVPTRLIPRVGAKVRTFLLALLVVAAATLTATVYYLQSRPDRQIDAEVAGAATRAASDGTVAVLSYGPDTADRDFATAKAHLTGDFLTYYSTFTQQIVGPAAKQKGVKTTAAVVQAAVSELHPDSAVVLVFVNQTTASTERPEPSMAASSVLVSMTKVNGNWLISKFDPV
jgi:Mce-associated membrane protein